MRAFSQALINVIHNMYSAIYTYKIITTSTSGHWIKCIIATFPQHILSHNESISRVSCKKGPTHHAYAWQIGPYWQDTLDLCSTLQVLISHFHPRFLYWQSHESSLAFTITDLADFI